jgi:hypothetical protein
MSANRRGPHRPLIKQWELNVGRMLGHVPLGAETWLNCARQCSARELVDLSLLVRERGPLFSLWNRRPKCPRCGGERFFTGHHTSGAFVTPFVTDDPAQTDDLHAIYEALKGKV